MTRIGISDDDVGKNETKRNIACARPSESRRKRIKKIEHTKKSRYRERITCLCSPARWRLRKEPMTRGREKYELFS